MKIAISTNDGLMMAPVFETCESFLILTIILGEIIEEEVRWRHEPGKMNLEEIFSQLSDCSLIIAGEISESSMRFSRDKSIPVIRTKEKIVTNVIVHYLEHQYREASDTCCCP
jgi:predicted Fe-Mo cluster-binding NifX family protein